MGVQAKSTKRLLHAELLRSRILEVSGSLFGKRGVEAVSVEDLLDASDISRRTFYKYFRSKDEVLVALFDVLAGIVLRTLESPAAENDPPLSELRTALERYLDFHANAQPILKVLAHEALRPGSPLAPVRARFQKTLMKVTDDALTRARCAPPDPLVHRALLGAIEAVSIELLSKSADRAEVDRAKAIVWDVVTRLLLPKK